MANWYCSSVDYTAVAQYATTHAYAAGAIVRQLATPTVGNERCFRTAAGGTTGSAEPTWTLTKGGSTTDSGGVVWVEVTGNETYQAAGAWSAPHARLANAVNQGWCVSGDTVYVAANHAETQTVSMTITVSSYGAALCYIVCVDNSGTGHVPPQAGDMRTTATVSTTGNASISWSASNSYCYGITFSAASGSTLGYGITIGYAGSGGSWQRFEACAVKLMSTGGASISMGQTYGAYVVWDNVVATFSATGQIIGITKCSFIWRRTAAAVLGTGVTQVLLDNGQSHVLIDSVDFSGINPPSLCGIAYAGSAWALVNCKLASGQAVYNSFALSPGTATDMISTDSASVAYRHERQAYEGLLTTSTNVVRTGGASDGAQAIAWKIVTSTTSKWLDPFQSFPIGCWNAVTGSNVTVTLAGIANLATIPNNDDVWIEVYYMGSAAAPLGSFVTQTKANVLATNAALTADTSAWDSLVTARANGHANVVGDIIGVSTNPGRVFFCTTSGTTAGSIPGGYAFAVDGGGVTDGTAVFRAGYRFRLVVVLSSPQPQMAGYLRATVKAAKVSTTFFIDPAITLS